MRRLLGPTSIFATSILTLAVACGGGGAGGAGTGGGTTGSDGGADAPAMSDAGDASTDADAAPPPPTPPFDWVGVIGTGQSLSVGATAGIISKAQPFKNVTLVDDGPAPTYPIAADAGAPQWATTPLVEPVRTKVMGTGAGYGDGQYPQNIAGETPHSGMANTLSKIWSDRGGAGDYVTAHSVVGWSGHVLTDIDKAGGKRAYPASINEARVFAQLAAAAGKSFGYGGIVLTHGESDAGNPAYGAGLYQLWQDYDTDLKAITGQTSDVVLFVSQQSTEGAGNAGNSAVQVWQAGVAHPGQIVCTGPKYAYQYSSDNLHLPAPGYERLGQKYAEVFDLVVNQKKSWKPLQPSKITRAGAVLTLDFDVPNPPLSWDTHVPPTHQTAHTEWAKGHGFEVTDATGKALTISQATIQGTSVILTLSAAPPAGTVHVAYAITQDGTNTQGGTAVGLHGQLRDADDFIGHDAETLPALLTQGSAAVASTTPGAFARRAGYDLVSGAGVAPDTVVLSHDSDDQLTLSTPWTGATGPVMLAFHHDAHNYCVHFSMDAP